ICCIVKYSHFLFLISEDKPPKPKLSIAPEWNMFYPTEKVTLKCSVDEESNKWVYEWFKNGTRLLKDKDTSFSRNMLSIRSAKAGHSGQYTCRGKHLMRTSKLFIVYNVFSFALSCIIVQWFMSAFTVPFQSVKFDVTSERLINCDLTREPNHLRV
uniref:Ig-like domain-containing protein n=1 Tax=Sinocyclocheilus grahami TaxID=75366 RepID=A0A672K8C3_SINGR